MLDERNVAAENAARVRELIDGLGTFRHWEALRELDELRPDWRESLASKEAADRWLTALRDERGRNRAEAFRALGAMGDSRAVGPAMATLRRPGGMPVDELEESVRVLGATRHVAGVEVLLEWLTCDDYRVQGAVVEALGRLHDRRATPALIELLPDADGYLQVQIVEALGALGDAHATEALVQALDSGSHLVRPAALRALRQLGWRPESPSLEALATIAERRWEALLSLGQVAVEPLLRAIRCELSDDDRPQEMLGVLEALVERFGSGLGADGLYSCASLQDLKVTTTETEYDEKDSPIGLSIRTSVLNCARVRDLAQREMERRAGR